MICVWNLGIEQLLCTVSGTWGLNNYCVLVPETQAALRQQERCKMWSRYESHKAKGCFMWFGMEMHKRKELAMRSETFFEGQQEMKN